QPANCGFVLPLLVGVADTQGIAHPSEGFLVEGQPAEQFGELLADNLLAHVGLVAPTLVSCAMVIDVALLLDRAQTSRRAVAGTARLPRREDGNAFFGRRSALHARCGAAWGNRSDVGANPFQALGRGRCLSLSPRLANRPFP